MKLAEAKLAELGKSQDQGIKSAREFFKMDEQKTNDPEQAAYILKYDLKQEGDARWVELVVEWNPVPGKKMTQKLKLKRPLDK